MSGVKAANFELTIGYEAVAVHCLRTSSNYRLMGRSPRMDLNTYSGEVPMSPKMMPSVTSRPATVMLRLWMLISVGSAAGSVDIMQRG